MNPTYTPIPYSPSGYRTFEWEIHLLSLIPVTHPKRALYSDFYPFYLGEHANVICRRLHLVGTGISVGILIRVLLSFIPGLLTRFRQIIPPAHLNVLRVPGGNRGRAQLLLFGVLQGYAFAWIGHFFL